MSGLDCCSLHCSFNRRNTCFFERKRCLKKYPDRYLWSNSLHNYSETLWHSIWQNIWIEEPKILIFMTSLLSSRSRKLLFMSSKNQSIYTFINLPYGLLTKFWNTSLNILTCQVWKFANLDLMILFSFLSLIETPLCFLFVFLILLVSIGEKMQINLT